MTHLSSCDRSTSLNSERHSCAVRPRRRTTRCRLSAVLTVASEWAADVGDEGEAGPYGRKPFIPDFGHPRGGSDWMKDAGCVGPSAALFFSDLGATGTRRSASVRDARCFSTVPTTAHGSAHRSACGQAGKEARLYIASRRAQADADSRQAKPTSQADQRPF